ncbi:hypothetical protein [Thermomonas sp.]|uniref:hypothetical protein n=1 Tax=Thermomonas sp. TaxID=1971895 RepID=UPI0039E5AD42
MFADRAVDAVIVLGAQMAHAHAVVARDHRAECGDFPGFGIEARHVFQPGGQAERAGEDVFLQYLCQPRDLRVGGRAGGVVDPGLPAQRTMPGAGGDVDVRLRALRGVEPMGQATLAFLVGARAAAILTEEDGGHAHRQMAGISAFERIAMRVQVDETGRKHPAAAFDGPCARHQTRRYLADTHDAFALHKHVSGTRRCAGAVDHAHVAQQQAGWRCISAYGARQQRGRGAGSHHCQKFAS